MQPAAESHNMRIHLNLMQFVCEYVHKNLVCTLSRNGRAMRKWRLSARTCFRCTQMHGQVCKQHHQATLSQSYRERTATVTPGTNQKGDAQIQPQKPSCASILFLFRINYTASRRNAAHAYCACKSHLMCIQFYGNFMHRPQKRLCK